jgi:DNA-binding transcriptional LysR family regulator
MSRWEGIHEFVQVVEAGSFTAAATRLAVSPSQISKLVARLEERLQARLLNRSTRRIVLTAEGELFYHRCKRIVESLDSAEEDISLHRSEARGRLHLSVDSDIGEAMLAPLIAQFLAEQPRVSIELTLTNGGDDLIGPGHDVGIRLGSLSDSSLIARKLCEMPLIAVASPAYLARHSAPRHPDELARHNCLVGSDGEWTFSDGSDTISARVPSNWRCAHATVRMQAAMAGAGIALLPARLVAAAIAERTLIPVLEAWNRHHQPLWAVYPQNRYLPARVRLLLDFLVQELGDANAMPFTPLLEFS